MLYAWVCGVRPFVKRYTGGKVYGWWLNTAPLQDYILARKIIRGEKIKTPISVRTFDIIISVNLILIALTIIEITWHNH